jgi:glycosyltransferase involved in cell wall biosynthesis
VYPPVATTTFYCASSKDYSLIVSEMVPYKQLDYAVRAFAKSGRKLKIAGAGPEYRNLRRLASSGASNIEFCGKVPDAQLRDLFAHCSEFIVPGEEDFGIATVEALASGKPVVALARGGSVEIVENGCGMLYAEPTEFGLNEALRSIDKVRHLIEPERLIARAGEFSEAAFETRFLGTLARFATRQTDFTNCLQLAHNRVPASFL